MNKEQFIANAATQFVASQLPHLKAGEKVDLDRMIFLAKALYEKLNKEVLKKEPVESKPKTGKDYYLSLSELQRKFFDLFWNAFNYKKGRNDAAKVWLRMGELQESMYQLIIEAAKKECEQRGQNDSTPIMAEGWLSHYRYKDHLDSIKTGNQLANDQIPSQLLNLTDELKTANTDINHFRKIGLSDTDAIMVSAIAKKDRIQKDLDELSKGQGAPSNCIIGAEQASAKQLLASFSMK
jgi:hypothetical protein